MKFARIACTMVSLCVLTVVLLGTPAFGQPGPCTRANLKQPSLMGMALWQCDPEGFFLRLQCNPVTGYCCCVEPRSGKCLKGSQKAPGTGLPQCFASATQPSPK